MAARLLRESQEDDEKPLFSAKLESVKALHALLKAIHFKDSATCFLSSDGLKVTVEDAKCLQANAFIQASIFEDFTFDDEGTTFGINLSALLECLSMFSTKDSTQRTAVRMAYTGYGSALMILIEESGVLIDCSIRTEEPIETLDFDFCSANVVNKAIVKAEGLREIFFELDGTSGVVEIMISPDAPYFRVTTFGIVGLIHFEIPKDSDMMESFDSQQTQGNRFKFALIKPSIKALALASKVSIRMDTRGFLSMQYLIQNEDGSVCFVEYLCVPDMVLSEEE